MIGFEERESYCISGAYSDLEVVIIIFKFCFTIS